MGLIFITHDLGIVRRIADRVYVMQSGEIVEHGATRRFSRSRKHPYTRALLAAEPEGRKAPPPRGSPAVLEGRRDSRDFSLGGGLFSPPPRSN